MRVTELNRDELDELKQTYASELVDSGEYEDVVGISYGELADSIVIPDNVIFDHFDGIDFTEDDFFCNQRN